MDKILTAYLHINNLSADAEWQRLESVMTATHELWVRHPYAYLLQNYHDYLQESLTLEELMTMGDGMGRAYVFTDTSLTDGLDLISEVDSINDTTLIVLHAPAAHYAQSQDADGWQRVCDRVSDRLFIASIS
jgi:hypothetical protein